MRKWCGVLNCRSHIQPTHDLCSNYCLELPRLALWASNCPGLGLGSAHLSCVDAPLPRFWLRRFKSLLQGPLSSFSTCDTPLLSRCIPIVPPISHHHTMSQKGIVALDPSTPLDPKPLIADILRTRHCVPGSVFLIEALERRVPVPGPAGHHCRRQGRGRRAVRLLLGDGELCIQALVRPELHCFVDRGAVYEGCYVRIDSFELRWMEGAEGRPGVNEDGEHGVVYLVVGDLVAVGWNEEYLEILRRDGVKREEILRGEEGNGVLDGSDGEVEAGEQPMEDGKSKEARPAASGEAISQTAKDPEPTTAKPPPDKDADKPDYISDSDDAFGTLEVSVEKADQRRVPISAPDAREELQTAVVQHNQNRNKPLPWLPNDPTQALKLTLLHSIPNLPYKQNWMVNVLAVVVSLSDVQPAHIPPHRQRTARLADPSTAKQVHLATFLNPETFTPDVGSVVLFLGVKNHLYDGGSLRKYVSDRPKNGTSWWIQHPETPEWCRDEAARLKEWWRTRADGSV